MNEHLKKGQYFSHFLSYLFLSWKTGLTLFWLVKFVKIVTPWKVIIWKYYLFKIMFIFYCLAALLNISKTLVLCNKPLIIMATPIPKASVEEEQTSHGTKWWRYSLYRCLSNGHFGSTKGGCLYPNESKTRMISAIIKWIKITTTALWPHFSEQFNFF